MTNDLELTKKTNRGIYLVDRRLQMEVVANLLGILFGFGAVYLTAIFAITGHSVLSQMYVSDARPFLLTSGAIYLGFASILLWFATIRLTHRMAGPAIVIRRALERMRLNEYDGRLQLRKKDYFQEVAEAAERLASHLREKDSRNAQLLAELSACFEANDLERARRVLREHSVPAVGGGMPSVHAPASLS
jgi:hypothetical protein